MKINKSEDLYIGIVGAGRIAKGLVKLCIKKQIPLYMFVRDKRKKQSLKHYFCDYQKKIIKTKKPLLISVVTELRTLSSCNIIIEAITEEEKLKLACYQSLKPFISKNTVIATTTSSLKISSLAKKSKLEEQFVGLHFFNPPQAISFLEVIPATKFNENLFQKIVVFIKKLDYDYVLAPDIPGFIANKVLFSIILASIEILEECQIKRKEIDKVVKSALKHPLGAFELIDFIGLKTVDKIIRNIYTNDKKKIRSWNNYYLKYKQ